MLVRSTQVLLLSLSIANEGSLDVSLLLLRVRLLLLVLDIPTLEGLSRLDSHGGSSKSSSSLSLSMLEGGERGC